MKNKLHRHGRKIVHEYIHRDAAAQDTTDEQKGGQSREEQTAPDLSYKKSDILYLTPILYPNPKKMREDVDFIDKAVLKLRSFGWDGDIYSLAEQFGVSISYDLDTDSPGFLTQCPDYACIHVNSALDKDSAAWVIAHLLAFQCLFGSLPVAQRPYDMDASGDGKMLGYFYFNDRRIANYWASQLLGMKRVCLEVL